MYYMYKKQYTKISNRFGELWLYNEFYFQISNWLENCGFTMSDNVFISNF